MPNNNVYNTESKPLFVDQVNTYTDPGVGTLQEWDAAVSGILFVANTSGSISGAQNLLLQVSNPGGSGKTMYISRISGGISIAGAALTVLKGGTFTGTTVTPVNFNLGSSGLSSMTSQRLAGTVGGSPVTLTTAVLTAGQYAVDYNGRIVIPPGNSITVSVGLGSATASINMTWWEY